MSITIKLWDLWVRLESRINSYLAPRVRKILQQREIDKADAFLKKFHSPDFKHTLMPVYKDPNAKCNHVKGGGRSRRYNPSTDYNIACHSFSDGRTKIWCLYNCGLVAWSGDPNFENLKKMLDKSSNTRSASERWAATFKVNKDGSTTKVSDGRA